MYSVFRQFKQIIKISREIQFWILVMPDATDHRIIREGEKVLGSMPWLFETPAGGWQCTCWMTSRLSINEVLAETYVGHLYLRKLYWSSLEPRLSILSLPGKLWVVVEAKHPCQPERYDVFLVKVKYWWNIDFFKWAPLTLLLALLWPLSQKQKALVNLVNGKLLVEEPQMQRRKVTYVRDGFMVRG